MRKIRSSSRPPTEVRGFHQTLKQKNKKQSHQKKNPSSHAGYQGIYSFDFKGFEITPREITLGRPFYSKWALTIIKQGCTHFPMNVTAQNIPSTKPKDLNQVEEKDREIPLYGHRHIKGRSNMCYVKPLCFNMK